MLRTLSQIIIAAVCALLSLFIETIVNSSAISNFLKEQGLTLISALFALNLTSIVYILTRFKEMEKGCGVSNFFKKSKEAIKSNVNELTLALMTFYAIMALSPDYVWEVPNPILQGIKYGTICHEVPRILARCITLDFWKCYPVVLAVAARVCIFHSLVVTYDFLNSIITSSDDPEVSKD